MTDEKFLDFIFKYILMPLIAILLVAVVLGAGSSIYLEGKRKTCLEAGFPKVISTWNYDVYCAGRLEGSDIVVPIERVEAR